MWHNENIKTILKQINSKLDGLNDEQIEINAKNYGSNTLQKKEKASIASIVWQNVLEPLTLILIGVIVICFFIQYLGKVSIYFANIFPVFDIFFHICEHTVYFHVCPTVKRTFQ